LIVDREARIPERGYFRAIDLARDDDQKIKKINNDAQESRNLGVQTGRPCRDWEQAGIRVLKFTWKLLR
jgi:hypothetical protein